MSMVFAPSNRPCSLCKHNQGLIGWRSERICDECWKKYAQCGRCKDWYFELKSPFCDGCGGATPQEFVAFDCMEQTIQAARGKHWWTDYDDPVDVAPWASMGSLEQARNAIESEKVTLILILCRLERRNECDKLSAHAEKHLKTLVYRDLPDSTSSVNATDILDNCLYNDILEVKDAGKKIFICCFAGFNRAPFVSTYIVATIEERPVLDVLKEVLNVRPCILGNKHFVLTLAKTAATRNEFLPEERETHLGVYRAPGGVYWSDEHMIARWLDTYCRDGVDPAGLQFKNFRDGVTASGASVYHMSLAGQWDGDHFDLEKFYAAAIKLNLAEIACVGRGAKTDACGNTVEFLAIACPAVQALRAQHELGPAELHITLAFYPYDVH